MNPSADETDPAYTLPDELIADAAKTWCSARRLRQPSMPALPQVFAPLGLDMVTASFDSLLCFFECAAGRSILIGTPEEPSADQLALCALLNKQTARPSERRVCDKSDCGLSLAIECAAFSIFSLVARPSDAM